MGSDLEARIKAALPCRSPLCNSPRNRGEHVEWCPAFFCDAVLQTLQAEVTVGDRERARAFMHKHEGYFFGERRYIFSYDDLAEYTAQVREQAKE